MSAGGLIVLAFSVLVMSFFYVSVNLEDIHWPLAWGFMFFGVIMTFIVALFAVNTMRSPVGELSADALAALSNGMWGFIVIVVGYFMIYFLYNAFSDLGGR